MAVTQATLQDAIAEIERTQRNNERLAAAGKLTPAVAERKRAANARAHKALTFLAANEEWILPVYQSRERMRREAEMLCAEDDTVRDVLDAFEGAQITDIRPLGSTTQEATP